MKSKLFLTVLLLAAITTIGISQEKDFVPFVDTRRTKVEMEKVLIAEEQRIRKLPVKIQSLVGIKGIYVMVEDLREDAKSAGLTKEQLKTDVELKLRLAGIKVNTEEDRLASKDGAYIYVNINANTSNGSPIIAYNVCVELDQKVTLARSPYRVSVGNTWDSGVVGLCIKREFPEKTRQTVKDHVDIFVNDYLTANPKK